MHTAADSGSGGAADGRTFAASGNGSDNAADNRASANFLGGVLAAGAAGFLVLVGLQVVGLSARLDLVELQNDFGLSGKFSGALHRNEMASEFGASGDGFLSVGSEGGVQGGVEGVAGLILLAVDGIDQANRDLRALVDDQLPGRGWWRRSGCGLIVGLDCSRRRDIVRTRREGQAGCCRSSSPCSNRRATVSLWRIWKAEASTSFPPAGLDSSVAELGMDGRRVDFCRRRTRCRRHGSRSYLKIVDDGLHAGDRCGLASGGIALRVVVDVAGERHDSAARLNVELLAGESGILRELALNLAGDFGVVRLAGARRRERKDARENYRETTTGKFFSYSTPENCAQLGPERPIQFRCFEGFLQM